MLYLSACSSPWKAEIIKPEIANVESKSVINDLVPSSSPIVDIAKTDIIYAQNALNILGYSLGKADGIWGPKSARAIRKFEQSHKLRSARGHLSELNLFHLEKITKLARNKIAKTSKPAHFPLSNIVDAANPKKGTPQLVIIERPRILRAKPNPYSEVKSQLAVGTGIDIISLQEGWYEVESQDQIVGFVKAN